MEKENNNSNVGKDWLIAGGAAAGFFALLRSAGWIDEHFDYGAIFNLVDLYAVIAKVALASALAWTIKKFVFPNTLGKDFSETFDDGWATMRNIEKTRWILAIYTILFVTVMCNI